MDNWITYLGNFFTGFWGVPFALEEFFCCLDAVLCAGHLHWNKKDILHFLISYACIAVSTFVLVLLSYSLTGFFDGVTFSQYIIIFALVLPGTLFLLFFEKASWPHRIIKTLMFISSAFVVTELSHHTNVAVNMSIGTGGGLGQFYMSLPHVCMLIVGFLVGYFNINRFKTVSNSQIIISVFSFIGVMVIAFLLSTFEPVSVGNEIIYLVTLIAFLATECGIYLFIYENMKKMEDELEKHTQETLNRAAEEMIQLNQNSIQQVTIARHDAKNHFSYLKGLLEQEKYEEAKTYISEYCNNLFEEMHVIDCGNPVVSSIMNLELSKARMASIEMKYFLAVPEKVSIIDSDLCSVITNLVDNAIEGYAKESKEGIEVRIAVREKCLRIYVKNPTEQKKATLTTTKKEPGHGMGTRIIKNIVRKYNGYIKFEVKDGYFVADSIMNMES